MRFALLALAIVTGCSRSPTVDVISQNAPPPIPPYCTFDLMQPEVIAGELAYDRRPPHTDCTTPDGGEVFSLGFAHDGWWLQLDAVRSQFTVGTPVRFEQTNQASLLALGCWNWIGEFTVTQDEVHGFSTAWSVDIDATCADDAMKRVVGQWWSGQP